MEWNTALAVFGTLVGIIGGIYGISRNKATDDTEAGRQSGTILTELGYIKAGVEDIKSEQREQRKINTELFTRMSAVEQSAKQAHHRLDRLEQSTKEA